MRYLQEFDVQMNAHVVRRRYGIRRLSGAQTFAVRHYSYSTIGCTIEWLERRLDATSEELAVYELSCMPEFLREVYADGMR